MCALLSKISRRALGILDLCLSFLLLASRLGFVFSPGVGAAHFVLGVVAFTIAIASINFSNS
jgi:hypothetical protein